MLTLQNVTKTFNPGTVNEKTALSGIDLHLEQGDFVTILGSNGAGKSTLFGAIAGSFPVDSGKILLDGADVTVDCQGMYLSPGFIDVHVHGAGGHDFMEGGEAVYTAARCHMLHGTTSIVPTTLTGSRQDLLDFVDRLESLCPDEFHPDEVIIYET